MSGEHGVTGEASSREGALQSVPEFAAMNFPLGDDGPIWTDQNGELKVSVLMCQWGNHRCKHLGWHDFHYP